ncbi:mechanosensitive ion channel family protein [Blattabacterium cuenoti]|uniref:mechanosensitive ion channel family protein n=1 Tax=Blattabacterium cuenoti TaxID=1653831 RepID=UPI00163D389E|nr:mechanosensitive ion channel domain-containing protein [Blattabacterium cuenoti]
MFDLDMENCFNYYFIIFLIFFGILIFFSKKFFNYFIKEIFNYNHFKWLKIMYKNNVFESLFFFVPFFIGFTLIKFFLKNYNIIFIYIEKLFNILFVLITLQLVIRVINSIMDISTNENNHQTIAIHSLSQLIKIISIIFCVLIIVAILTKNNIVTILTGLGAITAVVLLVFRDTILGFVSGIQMASTRMIKVGDWIGISKYNIEGKVMEINLVSAKIENFDKTITSVPTYDLISTAVTNYEVMRQKNIRRIKRSILFNIKSFHFYNEKKLKKFRNIYLIKDYILKKQKEISYFNKKIKLNSNINIVNGKRLTNIGLFRQYTLEYLYKHPNISQSETLMVRHLDTTPYGLPIELYCFVKTSESIKYEQIQANVFDHLLTAAKVFNLEITQVLTL